MADEQKAMVEKTRNAALRALALRCGLNSDQISRLKLDQVHLTTSSLVINPDEFAPAPHAAEQTITLDLDTETQKAIIAWLVVRPDGRNDNLFPGQDLEGLDLDTIHQVVPTSKAIEPEETERTDTQSDGETPTPVQAPETEDTLAVPMGEIEALRQQLAEVEDDRWSPVTDQTDQPASGDTPKVPIPPPETVKKASKTAASDAPGKSKQAEATMAAAAAVQSSTGSKQPLDSGAADEDQAPRIPHKPLILLAGVLAIVCCLGAISAFVVVYRTGTAGSLVAGIFPSTGSSTPAMLETPTYIGPQQTPPAVTPTQTNTALPAPTDAPSPTPIVTETPTPEPTPVDTPTSEAQPPTETATPEPEPTDTPVPTETSEGPPPTEEPTPEPTTPSEDDYKYPAPVLLEPANSSVVPGVINILTWEPYYETPLADNEWYAVRLVFLQQGQPVYNGDRVKSPEWRVPDRFYYMADGPASEYRWYVFVEGDNPDGTVTQFSPESEESVFQWN